jgi:hypothetical protein
VNVCLTWLPPCWNCSCKQESKQLVLHKLTLGVLSFGIFSCMRKAAFDLSIAPLQS